MARLMALKHLDIVALSMAFGIALTMAITYFIYPTLSDLIARIAVCVVGLLLVLAFSLRDEKKRNKS